MGVCVGGQINKEMITVLCECDKCYGKGIYKVMTAAQMKGTLVAKVAMMMIRAWAKC